MFEKKEPSDAEIEIAKVEEEKQFVKEIVEAKVALVRDQKEFGEFYDNFSQQTIILYKFL